MVMTTVRFLPHPDDTGLIKRRYNLPLSKHQSPLHATTKIFMIPIKENGVVKKYMRVKKDSKIYKQLVDAGVKFKE